MLYQSHIIEGEVTMAKRAPSKHITDPNEIRYILSLTEEDLLHLSVLIRLFSHYGKTRRFNPYDTIDIPPGSYGKEGHKNKNTFTTTVGRYIYNKIFIEKELFDLCGGYYNQAINKKLFNKIGQLLAHGLIEGKVELQVYKNYLNKTQKVMPIVTTIMNSETDAMYLIADKIRVKKKELLKKHAKEIEQGHYDIIPEIEKELIEYAKKELQDDGSLDVFDNNESADYGNNFKNMFVMKGLVKKTDGEGYNIIASDLMGGIDKSEYINYAASLVAGPYMRARKTATGGYWEKLFRVFEHVVLDKEGTDCGTKRTIEITLDKDMTSYVYCLYMVEGNKLIELTDDVMKKYEGKTIRIRFASLCENKNGKICHKCAGNKLYRLGITNIGSTVPQLGSKIKNINMKAFHDSQVVFSTMDPMRAFFPFGTGPKYTINEDTSDYGVKVQTIEEALLDSTKELLILNE